AAGTDVEAVQHAVDAEADQADEEDAARRNGGREFGTEEPVDDDPAGEPERRDGEEVDGEERPEEAHPLRAGLPGGKAREHGTEDEVETSRERPDGLRNLRRHRVVAHRFRASE